MACPPRSGCELTLSPCDPDIGPIGTVALVTRGGTPYLDPMVQWGILKYNGTGRESVQGRFAFTLKPVQNTEGGT